MKNRDIDNQIKELFQREAAGLAAPEEMKQQIDSSLAAGVNLSGQKKERRKRPVLAFAMVLLLLFASVSVYAAVQANEIRGRVNVEPVSENFKELKKIAKKAGYNFQGVEQFSNGYVFESVRRGYVQPYDVDGQPMGEQQVTLSMTYVKGTEAVSLSVVPGAETNNPVQSGKLVETYEWNGVCVYLTEYIHFELPLNWEELITEEDRRLLEEGLAGGGVDSYNKEIVRHKIYAFRWYQDGGCYYLSTEGLDGSEQLIEEMKVIAREWVEAN